MHTGTCKLNRADMRQKSAVETSSTDNSKHTCTCSIQQCSYLVLAPCSLEHHRADDNADHAAAVLSRSCCHIAISLSLLQHLSLLAQHAAHLGEAFCSPLHIDSG